MFDWLKALLSGSGRDPASAADAPQTRRCRSCGRLFSCHPSSIVGRDLCPQCRKRRRQGKITRTCKKCGKTFTLPEEVQYWPDYCQDCRAKYRPVETITRTCRGCGREFTFEPSAGHWPKYCRDCRESRRERHRRM